MLKEAITWRVMKLYRRMRSKRSATFLALAPSLIMFQPSVSLPIIHCAPATLLSSSIVPGKAASPLGRIFPQPFTQLTLCPYSSASFSEKPSLVTPHKWCPLSLSLSFPSFISLCSPQKHLPFHSDLFAYGPFPPLECNPHIEQGLCRFYSKQYLQHLKQY